MRVAHFPTREALLALWLAVPFAAHSVCSGDCTNGIGTFTRPDGTKTEAKWVDGNPSGHVRVTFPDASLMLIDVEKWFPLTGARTRVLKDGSHRTGYFLNGEVVGESIYSAPDGRFVGKVGVTGMPEGPGTLEMKSHRYVGDFVHSMFHGRGELTWTHGRFSGDFVMNEFHGQGTFKNASLTYSGTWARGLRSGQGVENYSSGARYSGTWRQDVMSGKGTFTFKDGSRYEGRFADGQPVRGEGQLLSRNGQVTRSPEAVAKALAEIDSNFVKHESIPPTVTSQAVSWSWPPDHSRDRKDVVRWYLASDAAKQSTPARPAPGCTGNCIDGTGTLVAPGGQIYVGTFSGGKMHGSGRFVNSRSTWVGGFRNGLTHGHGIWTHADGWSIEGTMQQGAFAGPVTLVDPRAGRKVSAPVNRQMAVEGQGTEVNGFGDTYEGGFKNGSYHGSGVLKMSNGVTVDATFLDGAPTRGKIFSTQGTYEGDLSTKGPHGQGTLVRSDGRKFVGQFRNGQPVYAKGTVYLASGEPAIEAVARAAEIFGSVKDFVTSGIDDAIEVMQYRE